MEEGPDQTLTEQNPAGFSEEFGFLAEKYQRKVYEIAYNFTRNVDEANDLSQEIFLKAYRSVPNFESSSTFYTWLYRIAYNAGIDYTRKRKRRPVYLFSDDFPSDESVLHPRVTDSAITNPAEADETMAHIKQAMAKLSPKQKQVFVLRYYQHLPLKKIAEVTGIKTGTVKAHLFYAIRTLRQQLADYMSV